jgi:hemerythrin superfamily protein
MATALKKKSSMDVYKKLKEDHRKVEGLFEKILKTDESDEEKRTQLFQQIFEELEAHALAEEKIFYPKTEEAELTHDLTLEAHEEHALVKQLLRELKDMDNSSDVWSAKVKVLSELVKHHVKEEETELCPKSKKVFSKEEAIQAAEDIEQEEENVKEEIQSSAA